MINNFYTCNILIELLIMCLCDAHLNINFCLSVPYISSVCVAYSPTFPLSPHATMQNLFYCFPMLTYSGFVHFPTQLHYTHRSTPLMPWSIALPTPFAHITVVCCLEPESQDQNWLFLRIDSRTDLDPGLHQATEEYFHHFPDCNQLTDYLIGWSSILDSNHLELI